MGAIKNKTISDEFPDIKIEEKSAMITSNEKFFLLRIKFHLM